MAGDRGDAVFKVGKGALALSRSLLAHVLDFGARFHAGLGKRSFDRGGVSLNEVAKLICLVRKAVERLREFSVALLQRAIDLEVGILQRASCLENVLTLVLEPSGNVVDLPQQVF